MHCIKHNSRLWTLLAEIEDISTRVSGVLGRAISVSITVDIVPVHIFTKTKLGVGGESGLSKLIY